MTDEERREAAARLRDYPLALLISMRQGVKDRALAVLGELMGIVGADHGEPGLLYYERLEGAGL